MYEKSCGKWKAHAFDVQPVGGAMQFALGENEQRM